MIIFLARARSSVTEAKRGRSWFSEKDPSRLVSLQSLFTLLIVLARFEMLPDVLENASNSGKYLFVRVSLQCQGAMCMEAVFQTYVA